MSIWADFIRVLLSFRVALALNSSESVAMSLTLWQVEKFFDDSTQHEQDRDVNSSALKTWLTRCCTTDVSCVQNISSLLFILSSSRSSSFFLTLLKVETFVAATRSAAECGRLRVTLVAQLRWQMELFHVEAMWFKLKGEIVCLWLMRLQATERVQFFDVQ